jgi:hypothetical protein
VRLASPAAEFDFGAVACRPAPLTLVAPAARRFFALNACEKNKKAHSDESERALLIYVID